MGTQVLIGLKYLGGHLLEILKKRIREISGHFVSQNKCKLWRVSGLTVLLLDQM